jgi:aminopeptidase
MYAFERNIEKYAELVVKVGANIQPNQVVIIEAELESAVITRQVVRKAYEAGAKFVQVIWYDDDVTRARFDLAGESSFTYTPEWNARMMEQFAEGGGALIQFRMPDPDLYKGIDPAKVSTAIKTASIARRKFSSYTRNNDIAWCLASTPTKAWAAKVFPNLPEDKQVSAMWETIFKIVRVDTEDPIAAWHDHIKKLKEMQNLLNSKKYVRLQYKAPGTDLSVELPEGHIWLGGGEFNKDGNYFVPNMPTEEVFSMPKRGGVNGTLRSTMPLNLKGAMVDKFAFTLKDGKVVDYTAEVGLEHLKSLLETDEGSSHLGEIALVPYDSPISNLNLIFYTTLIDENASCHFALGNAYPINIDNGTKMTQDELLAHGANTSLSHVDFMVGSAELDIDGELADGTIEPIFRKGNWAF